LALGDALTAAGLWSHQPPQGRLRFCRLSHKKAWEKREEELWQLKKQQFFDFLGRGSPAR
jgi:hypothetical protein